MSITILRESMAESLKPGPWGGAAAVMVLLNFRRIADDQRFTQHVDDNGIYWDRVLDGTWSTGERFLIATAADLWTGRPHGADVAEVTRLSDDFYATWQAMVNAAMTGVVPPAGG